MYNLYHFQPPGCHHVIYGGRPFVCSVAAKIGTVCQIHWKRHWPVSTLRHFSSLVTSTQCVRRC